jgi:hypothetical protein
VKRGRIERARIETPATMDGENRTASKIFTV